MPARLSRNAPGARGCLVLDHDRNQEPHHEREGPDGEETAAPTDRRGREGERCSRDEGADRSDADLQPGQCGKAIGWKPLGIDGERRHQRARRSKPEQGATEDQDVGACGCSEYHGAEHRDRGAHHQTQTGAEAIERHAQGNLDGGKGEKERARQNPDLGRREPEVVRQVGGDDANRIAQELADDVDRDERRDERDRGARGRRRRSGLDAHEPGL